MTGRNLRETDRNIRSLEFLTERAADFAAIALVAALIAQLQARVDKVQATFQKQISEGENVRQDYDEVRDAYQNLLDDVREIAGIGVSISKRETGFNELFPYPTGSGKRKLIAEARAAADNAAAHEQKFTDRGMEADFIADLRQKADALDNALNNAASSTGKRVGATDTLGKEVEAASDIVEEINPIVKKVYKNNPTNLAAWKFASHVERHTPKPRAPKPATS